MPNRTSRESRKYSHNQDMHAAFAKMGNKKRDIRSVLGQLPPSKKRIVYIDMFWRSLGDSNPCFRRERRATGTSANNGEWP
jgi:hypothetical protein